MGAGAVGVGCKPGGRPVPPTHECDRVQDALAGTLPAVAEHLDAGRADVLAFSSFLKEIWLFRDTIGNNRPTRPSRRAAIQPQQHHAPDIISDGPTVDSS